MPSAPACLRVAIAFACLAIPLAAADIKVTTEHDKLADFKSLRSYAWLPAPPYHQGAAPDVRDPRLAQEVLEAPIRDAVNRVLSEKRYRPVSGTNAPDFHIVYYAAFGVGINADVLGAHYGYLTGWGSPMLGTTPTSSPGVIEEGTLVIDILRADRARAIWRGTATGAVDRTKSDDERRRTIDTAVQRMFEKFPAR